MKKPLLIFASILLAVLSYGGAVSLWAESSVVAATSTVKLYVSPATTGITTGYTTALQLRLYKNSSAKVDYAEAHVSFSTANLEVVSISKAGSYFNYGGGPSVSYNNSNGLISVMGSGSEMGLIDDVLLATVTFKGKAAGTGAVSYTSASQAGDITNGGHVKNVLDTRVGATVNISNPVASGGGGGTSGGTTTPTNQSPAPTTPAATTPAPAAETPATPTTATPTTTSIDTSPTSQTPASDVSTAIEQTVTKPPTWLQLLLPAAGLVGVVGMGGLGYALYLKRHRSGVTLPPEDSTDTETMPSTEAFAVAENSDVISERDPAASDDVFGVQPMDQDEPALPEFNASYAPSPISTQEVPPAQPGSLDDVLAQPAELVPTELQEVPASEPSTLVEPPAQGPQADAYAPPVVESTATLKVSASAAASAPEVFVPEATPTPEYGQQTPAQAPMVMSPAAVEAAAPPLPPPVPDVPVAAEALPTPPSAVEPAVMPSAATQTEPVATEPVDPTQPIDYKNMPDMYEVGAQRLQNEGFGEVTQPVTKVQPV